MNGRWLVLAASLGCASLLLAASETRQATPVEFVGENAAAELTIDAKAYGQTPTTVYDLLPGLHRYRLAAPGFVAADGFFELFAGTPQKLQVELEPEKGILLLKSEPADAEISQDGVVLGRTPRLFTHLNAADTWRFTLSKAGYNPATVEVRFSGRTPVVKKVVLASDTGTLVVASEPAGAEVLVNGVAKGVAPLKVAEVPRGRVKVFVRKEGYVAELREVEVAANREVRLAVTLEEKPVPLCLLSVPEVARFYINGTAYGKGPVETMLKPGTYRVRAEADGWVAEEREIVLSGEDQVTEEFMLESNCGSIEVKTTPPGATVVLDGRIVGRTTALDAQAETSDLLTLRDVAVGERTLVVRLDGYREFSRTVKVQPKKTSRQHRIRLERAFIPDVRIITATAEVTGVLRSQKPEYVEVETSPGVMRLLRRSEVRKLEFLKGAK